MSGNIKSMEYFDTPKSEEVKNIYNDANICLFLLSKVRKWISEESFQKFYDVISNQVIGQPNLKIFLANVYNYLKRLGDNLPTNNNVILTAPSGSGKTETYRALKKYFSNKIPGFPIHIVDLSQITASGFKGADPSDMITPFIVGKSAIGICFLDEFDKKLEPSFTGKGVDANREVQNNLLTIIEGGNITTKQGLINTSDIMFIGLGSFDKFREKRENKPNVIGFGADNNEELVDHFEPISRENMLEHGGTNELLGRFPFIINYCLLSDEAIDRIIDRTVTNVEENYDCEIIISKEYKEELHKAALSKFGCRQLDSTIRTLALEEYTKSLYETGQKLVINIENESRASHYWRHFTVKEADQFLNDISVGKDKRFGQENANESILETPFA